MFSLKLLGAGSHFWKELGMVGRPFVVQSSLMTRQCPKRKLKVSDDTTGPNPSRQETNSHLQTLPTSVLGPKMGV